MTLQEKDDRDANAQASIDSQMESLPFFQAQKPIDGLKLVYASATTTEERMNVIAAALGFVEP